MPEIELNESTIAILKDIFMGEKYSTLGELIDKLFLSLSEFFKQYQYAVSINQCHIIRIGDDKPLCGSLAPYKTFKYDVPEDSPICDDCRDIYWGIPEHISKN